MAELIEKDIFQELPLEIGKTYKTKFATGDLFKVENIIKKTFKNGNESVERIVRIDGFYVGKEHIGICPLPEERLIHEKIHAGKITCCPTCGTEIQDHFKKENEKLKKEIEALHEEAAGEDL